MQCRELASSQEVWGCVYIIKPIFNNVIHNNGIIYIYNKLGMDGYVWQRCRINKIDY